MTVEVVTPPVRFKAVCPRCRAGLEYTGVDLQNFSNGSSRWGKNYIYGVKCPACEAVCAHNPPPIYPPAPPRPAR